MEFNLELAKRYQPRANGLSTGSAATEYWAQSDNELSLLLSTAVGLKKSIGLADLYKRRVRAASIRTRGQTSHQEPRLLDTCEPCHWYDPIIPNETTSLLQYSFRDATGLSSWRCGMSQIMIFLVSKCIRPQVEQEGGLFALGNRNTLGLSVRFRIGGRGHASLAPFKLFGPKRTN